MLTEITVYLIRALNNNRNLEAIALAHDWVDAFEKDSGSCLASTLGELWGVV